MSDGSRLTWEYPRQANGDEQMDIVEVMEIRVGLIEHHRVYWDWYSVKLCEELQRSGRLRETSRPAGSGLGFDGLPFCVVISRRSPDERARGQDDRYPTEFRAEAVRA